MSTIGMMEGAYFVSRGELLQWLNNFLKLSYIKIEQVCSGSAFCQLMDAIHPGKVQMSKVNFNAKLEYEYIKNYKVLQAAFDKVHLEKRIEVDKLVKGKYQDNLEFLQWFKAYFDRNYPGGEYDAAGRRSGSNLLESNRATQSLSVDRRVSRMSVIPGMEPRHITESKVNGDARRLSVKPGHSMPAYTVDSNASLKVHHANANYAQQSGPVAQKQHNSHHAHPLAAKKSHAYDIPTDHKSVEALHNSQQDTDGKPSYHELELIVDGMERERDFYYHKLLQIEQILSQQPQNPVFEHLLEILYAGNDENEASEQSATRGVHSVAVEDCF